MTSKNRTSHIITIVSLVIFIVLGLAYMSTQPGNSSQTTCMVRNANENPDGDPLKINEHFCKVAKLNRKIVLDWKERIKNA